MLSNPKKEKIVNGQEETPSVTRENEINNKDAANAADNAPLAPIDPRLRKPGNEPLPANQDPLNGVNE